MVDQLKVLPSPSVALSNLDTNHTPASLFNSIQIGIQYKTIPTDYN